MEYFRNQPPVVAFDAVTLSDDYTDNEFVMDVGGFTKLSLDIAYTRGAAEAASDLHFKIEHSPDDGTNWYSLVIDATTTSSIITPRVWDIEAAGKYNVIIDIAYKKIKLSLNESGVSSNDGTATVYITPSGL